MNVKVSDILKHARQHYQALDKHIAQAIAPRSDLRCTRGCAACCYLLVTCSFIEVMVIAERIMRTYTPEERQRLIEQLDAASARILDKEQYMREQRPCVFLRLGEGGGYRGECTIYSSRPLACRLHFVSTDPALCSPDDPTTDVGMLDTREAHLMSMRILSGDNPLLVTVGPMAPLLAEAIRCLSTNRWPPSTLVLEQWRRRGMAMLNHDREMLVRLGKTERYVK